MRIVYVSHWRFPSEKTMSPLIMKTCEMFAKLDVEVELWMPWRQNPAFARLDPFSHHAILRNFVIRRFPAVDLTAILPGNVFFFLMLVTFQISVFLRTAFVHPSRGSIFYFHDIRDAVLISLLRRPQFVEIHDFYKSSLGWINRWCFSRMSGFVVTNRLKMEALQRDFGVPEKRMLHQPNAVDIEMFTLEISRKEAREKLNLPKDKKIILYAGHLFDWKGTDTLFDAHTFLTEDEVIYFVGGTDEDTQKFKSKIQNPNFKTNPKSKIQNVAIVGRRSHQEIPLWLHAADVLVLPSPAKFEASKYETSPVKLFEYMCSGRPIIASDVPSIRDVVDERTVFFFEPDNSQSLAATIHSVLSDPLGATMRAEKARREAQNYSWEKRTLHVVSFIRSRASYKT